MFTYQPVIYLLIAAYVYYVCVWVCVPKNIWRGHKTLPWIQFIPYTEYILGNQSQATRLMQQAPLPDGASQIPKCSFFFLDTC